MSCGKARIGKSQPALLIPRPFLETHTFWEIEARINIIIYCETTGQSKLVYSMCYHNN